MTLDHETAADAHQVSWVFFCDESGNAGANFLDREQPFHVAAGILIRRSDLAALGEAVAMLRGQSIELKGSRLMKSDAGRARAARVLQNAAQCRALPFFIVYERSFSLAGKILEVFADPDTNPSASWLPLGAKERREALSTQLLEAVSEESLTMFASAHRTPSREGLLASLSDTILNVESAVSTGRMPQELLTTLRAATGAIDSILEAELTAIGGINYQLWSALNIPAFTYLVRRADKVLDTYGEKMEVIHDEVKSFEDVMQYWVQSFAADDDVEVDGRTEGGRPWRLATRNVGGFATGSSEDHAGLQVADVLASSVAKLFREIDADGAEWTSSTKRLASLILPALLHDAPALAGCWVSEATKRKFEHRLGSLLVPS